MVESAVIVITVKYSFEVDEKVPCLSLGEPVYGRRLENRSSFDKEPGVRINY